MRQYPKLFLIVISAIFITGCATVTTGPTQKVPVTSNPSGAIAKVDGTMPSVTPTEFLLERKNDHIIEISKEGYRTATVALKRTLCGSVAGNLVLGGIVGAIVDTSTGAAYKLVPEKVHVDLERAGRRRRARSDTAPSRQPTKKPATIMRRPVRQKEPVSPKSSGLSPAERLDRLETLYKKGVISKDKYEEERKLILRSIGGE